MASSLTLQSKLKLKSGYEIPLLGYGVSHAAPPRVFETSDTDLPLMNLALADVSSDCSDLEGLLDASQQY